jgi:gliding motility-associated-like protein
MIKNASNVNFEIFNRWGMLVFETNHFLEGWDGNVNLTPAAVGVYFWKLSYDDTERKAVIRNGFV